MSILDPYNREAYEADLVRYRARLAEIQGMGLPDDHPLVTKQQQRILTVERVLDKMAGEA